ncbi:rubredoxin [Magnetovibrio sp. PR-2]|uniref:rubredoxin n=1 Tax=Magnetovibrio sp. PR-2 TaxID=3120356 RepID=UPI002FCDECC4
MAASGTQRFICTYNECDPYIYDPVLGDPDNVAGDYPIPPGTPFADLPEGWLCPVCGSPVSYFEETDERPRQ